ncbi:hypothetical protein AgCh_024360 [Apium graveolens]
MLDSVVAENQRAFIPGRLITDNIMISFEIMHYLKRKRRGKEGYMALKLDMSKAYDHVEWDYLKAMLLKLGFNSWWVHLVLQCVSTVTYTITHGNREMGPIVPTRGIRQGDPISPCLLYVRKAFHLLFEGMKCLNRFKANEKEAYQVLDLLNEFEIASGQKVNLLKSSVFFSTNIIPDNRDHVCQILQMAEAGDRSMYLGLPTVLGRNKVSVLNFLKDKVSKCIQSWDGRLVSQAGKEILIKSVAQTIPSYAMSLFLLPLELTKDIERRVTKYWWNSNPKKDRAIHWMGWDRLSCHKSSGGLGFKIFRDFNIALLGKQGWRFISRPESLVAKVFKAKYFPKVSFLEAERGNNSSYIWRSVWEAKLVLLVGLKWSVGSGVNIKITGQPWLGDDTNPYITTDSGMLEQHRVSNLFCNDKREWDIDLIRDMFDPCDQGRILSTKINTDSEEDQLYWCKENAGMYTVRSAYRLLQIQKGLWQNSDSSSLWRKIWQVKAPTMILNFLWKALSNCLPTRSQLVQKFIQILNVCPFCNAEEETVMHVLVTCPIPRQCWLSILPGVQTNSGGEFSAWLEGVFQHSPKFKGAEITTMGWAIWRARNEMVWNQKQPNIKNIVVSAMQYLGSWRNAQVYSVTTRFPNLVDGEGIIVIVKGCPYWTCFRHTYDKHRQFVSLSAVKFNVETNEFKLSPEFQFDTMCIMGLINFSINLWK